MHDHALRGIAISGNTKNLVGKDEVGVGDLVDCGECLHADARALTDL
jgi:hypothetical protein